MCDPGSFVETPTPFPQYTRGLVVANMVWVYLFNIFIFVFAACAAADPVAEVARAAVARAAAAAELRHT